MSLEAGEILPLRELELKEEWDAQEKAQGHEWRTG